MKAAFCFVIYLRFVASNIEECSRDYSDTTCGVDQEFKAPWLAVLGQISQTNTFEKVICSGSILTKKYIVTAAHCFSNPNIPIPTHVRVGDNNYLEASHAEQRKIMDKKIHPDYVWPTFYFDIAIITVDKEFKFCSRISPICLPTTHLSNPASGTGIFVQGWGEKGIKATQVSVNILSKESLPFKS